MSARIDSSLYLSAHGKAPRGRGTWAFSFDHDHALERLYFTPGDTLFSDACRLARSAAPVGTAVIHVQS